MIQRTLLVGLCLLIAPVSLPAQDAAKTGVELVPPSPKEKPLYRWHLDDAKTKKRIASVDGRWGVAAVPPGEYLLILHQYEVAVPYETVKVTKDQISRVEVKAGLELVGRTAKEPPLYRWMLVDPKAKKEITHVDGRWGFTPVPPGEYELWLQKHEDRVLYSTVRVEKDKPARVEVKTGVEVLGRTTKEPPLYRWSVVDPKTKKAVTTANERWGFTPVPPGEYELVITKYETAIPWGAFKLEPNKVLRFDIKSGVELAGNSPKDKPPLRWSLVDSATKKVVTYVNARWGYTPAPPGEYELRIRQDNDDVPFTTVRIAKDRVARVEIKSGVELVGRSSTEKPPERWILTNLKTGKALTTVGNRWGFAPMPPGEYGLQIGLPNSPYLDWGTVKVPQAGVATIKIASGIELLPREANEKPPAKWYIFDSKKDLKKPILEVRQRWGLVMVPAGDYVVTDRPGSFSASKVKVPADGVVKVQFPDLPTRFAGVTSAGRQTEKQRDPAGFKKLEEEIERAIRRAAAWLKKQPQFAGKTLDVRDQYPTLGILALIHAGELERDPVLAERCLDYLLRRPLNISRGSYATPLTAMSLVDLDPHAHSRRILECAQWLVENQGWDKRRKVWGYGDPVPGIGELKKERITIVSPPLEGGAGGGLEVVRRGLIAKQTDYWDNSCSQFAVLGLHSASHAGIKIPREVWSRVESHFREVNSENEGGWAYHGRDGCTGSMTCAGVASLLLARHHLGEKQAALDPAIVRGLEWLAGHFDVEQNPRSRTDHYYSLYGLERVGVLAGTEFLGAHEWYPEGARYLLANQSGDGSWRSKTGPPAGSYDSFQDTCYAILFLRRATLPPVPPKPALVRVTYQKGRLPPAVMPNVELVLDCSGSMADKIAADETRMQIARRVMNSLIDELPDTFKVGFRVFGHQGFWDWRTKGQAPDKDPRWYTDTELLVPMGPLSQSNRRAQMKKWITYMEPAGATPLCYALLQARKDFAAALAGPKAVILISDGLENCGGKMEDVQKAYEGAGIDVVIHVVGFAIGEKEHKVLESLAKWTKGNYYRAADATQLANALRDAAGSLHFVVHKEGGLRPVAQAVLNDRGVVLKPGTYRVSIPNAAIEPATIRLEEGQRLELRLDESGKLTPAK